MSYSEFTALGTLDLFGKLKTGPLGLSEKEASELLAILGENKIQGREVKWFSILLRQFKSPFVYLLFISFLISFLLGEIIDALMILLFVGINTVLGFYQEYKSASAVKLLKKYLVSKIKVIRNGQEKNIETLFLVPGDVLILEPGDIIPADVRFIESNNLIVNEEVLTGESQPVQKFSSPIKKEIDEIYEAENIGFCGTILVGGKGKAVVFATADNTNYANIASLASETERESTFEKELGRFSKFTLLVVLAVLIFVVVTSISIKPDPSLIELALFSIALAVSVIPEALPVVTTFSLSIGAIALAKKNVVVKRLSAIEDLGAIEVLASDKTGTLTKNKLTLEEVYAKDEEDCILKANLASGDLALSLNIQNNAFDYALAEKLDEQRARLTLNSFKKLNEIPFDPNRRRITVMVSDGIHKYIVSRGAPEEILEICKLSQKDKEKLQKWASDKGKKGRRVLAVADRELKNEKTKELKDLEKDLQFLGLITFSDPIKESAYKAVESAKILGVVVKILTGDSPEVAANVAMQVKLIESLDDVITGIEFERLSVTEKHNAVEKYQVFARVTPQQKYDIIKLLQEKYSVGFLGEGINDAPALKIANVGIVVAGAADVAREACDILLLERSLQVILDGIRGGRKVFENTSKYITATMASNFGNFFAVAIIAPFINFLPMLPLQILLVNLLSDFPMISVATDNVDEELLITPKRYNLRSFAISALTFGIISTAFDFVLFSSFIKSGEARLQTYWFIESILSELLFLFSIRSKRPFFATKRPSKPLVYLTIFTILFTITIPMTKAGRDLFGFIKPTASGLFVVFAIVFTYLLSNEAVKLVFRKLKKRVI